MAPVGLLPAPGRLTVPVPQFAGDGLGLLDASDARRLSTSCASASYVSAT